MLKQFAYFGASRLAVLGGQLLLIPIAVSQIGAAGYGVYNLLVQGAAFIRLVSLQGVGQVLVRDGPRLAESHGESRLYSNALIIVVASLLTVAMAVIFFEPLIGSSFHLSRDQVWLALAMGSALAYFGLGHIYIYNRSLSAYTAWDTIQILGVTFALILAGLVVPTVEAFAATFAVVTVFVAVIMFHGAARAWPNWRTLCDITRLVRRYGMPLMLGEGLAWIVAVADRFQIAAILDLEQTGIYVAAYQLFVAPASMLGFTVALIVQPAAFASDAKKYRECMEYAATLLVILCILYVIPVVLVGKQVFALLFRQQAEVGNELIVLLVLAGIANSFLYLEIIAGKYTRNTTIILVAQASAAFLILLGNWLLLPQIGIIAAAMTSVLAYLLQITIVRYSIGRDYNFRYFSATAAGVLQAQFLANVAKAFRKV